MSASLKSSLQFPCKMIAHVVLGCFWFWLHVHMSWQPNLRPHSGLIPHHGPAPRGPQDSGVVRSLVGCQSEGDSALLRVTSVVYSSACSDSTYTGRHLLCPLLVTMLAKSRSQTEWAPPPPPPVPPTATREQTATTSFHQSCVDSLTLRALIRTVSGKGGGRNTEAEATLITWHEGLQKLRLLLLLFVFF